MKETEETKQRKVREPDLATGRIHHQPQAGRMEGWGRAVVCNTVPLDCLVGTGTKAAFSGGRWSMGETELLPGKVEEANNVQSNALTPFFFPSSILLPLSPPPSPHWQEPSASQLRRCSGQGGLGARSPSCAWSQGARACIQRQTGAGPN